MTIRWHILALPFVLLATACTPLLPTPESVIAPQLHVLRPEALPSPVVAASGAPVLSVIAVSAGPLLDGRSMRYRDAEGGTSAFADHRWAALPEAQLGSWLVAALERAGGVTAVVAPGGRAQATLLLESELLVLELMTEPSPGEVQLELRLQLVVSRTREIVATTRLRETEALAEPGPAAMAAASGRALTRLLDAGTAFVRNTVAIWSGPPGRG